MSEGQVVEAKPVEEEKGLVRYVIRHPGQDERPITLNTAIVRRFFCPEADDLAAFTFMGFCRAHNLDPFAREAYLSMRKDYQSGEKTPVIQVAYTTFMKRAERHRQYKGHKAGLVLQKETSDTPDIESIEGVVPATLVAIQGELTPPGWTLIGGWALVYRKDRDFPAVSTVALADYIATKQSGEPMALWRSKKATMIRKTAIAHGFQGAFPDEVGDMRVREEFDEEPKPGDEKPIPQPEEPKALPAHVEDLFSKLGWNKANRAIFLAQNKGLEEGALKAKIENILAERGTLATGSTPERPSEPAPSASTNEEAGRIAIGGTGTTPEGTDGQSTPPPAPPLVEDAVIVSKPEAESGLLNF